MAATKTMSTDLKSQCLAEFEQLEKQTSQSRPALRRLRKAAISRFGELGFPGPRDEEWRFTPLTPLLKPVWQQAPGAVPCAKADIERLTLPAPECSTLAFVNGRFRPEISDRISQGEAFVGPLANAIDRFPELVESHLGRIARFEQQTFTALNTALFADAAVVYLPARCRLERPLRILHLGLPGPAAATCHPRILIIAEAHSQAAIVETYAGEGLAFVNAVTELHLAEEARIDHCKLQQESRLAIHVGAMHVRLARGANFRNHSFALGGNLVRNDFTATLEGPGAECTLNGLTLADGSRLVDNHTNIIHLAPHCPSHELYKNVVRDQAKVVFNGKIYVHQEAQKTDAKQTNQTLLLSPDGTINTKPQLEIFADDVKCTHGATVGQLRGDALFYLRSRGIGLEEARALLTFAFANELIERIELPSLRQGLEHLLLAQEHLAPLGSPQEDSR